MKTLAPFLLILGAALLPGSLLATDADADGMDDAWETSMGLNPADPLDAFSDKDGDRVSNLWEYNRGTNANNVSSVPAFDATVDCTQPTDAMVSRYATLQEAYNSLPTAAVDPNYRAVVSVLRGKYEAPLTGNANPKKVAWIGQVGASRLMGVEGAVITGGLTTSGVLVTDETVFDGLIFENPQLHNIMGGGGYERPAVWVKPDASLVGLVTEVRLVNCIIRNWRILYDPYGYYGMPHRGAILNDGGDLWLVHTTVCNSLATNYFTSGYESMVRNLSGTLRVINSIIWESSETTSWNPIMGTAPATVTTSVIQSGVGSAINTDPSLTPAGYLTTASTACVGAATNLNILYDLNAETRSTTGIEIGADEWVNTDGDSLPDWWEQFWFGNLSQGNAGDPDADWATNFDEYYYATAPVEDQDADGLPDVWEYTNFSTIWAQNGAGNPDADMASNLLEYTWGTDPNVFQADWDNDGWTDTDEMTWFGTYAQTAWTDFDGDGLLNGLEFSLSSDPTLSDTNGDGILDGIAYFTGLSATSTDTDGDGLSNAVELALGTNPMRADTDGDGVNDATDPFPLDPTVSTVPGGANVAGPPVLTIVNPPGAVVVP